ncbi:MAG: homoserine dehydrogenase, partial [[Eubacterium] sulci]|nr:homoserine dehydrogenase [[Eubacterium] sulci]
MKKVKIGLLGFGTVAGGTFDILKKNAKLISKRSGCEIEVAKVFARNTEKALSKGLPAEIATANVDDVLADDSIDIVVEAIGGIEPATEYMLKAMKAGKHVVTPNKAAVAANYKELTETAKANNVSFRFEASVGGGIPALTAIQEALSGNEFLEVMGIVNGTTNYILSCMQADGMEYKDALKDAQIKGFAEADPTADVEGIDAANKLSILMTLCFDKYVKPGDIPTTGISKITMKDIEDAEAKDSKIKLIASAKLSGDQVEYSVKPVLMPN